MAITHHIVTSHPHEHRIVILGEPVDLARSAEGEPPSAELTESQAEHVRSWPATLAVPRHVQDPLGRWRDPETGQYVDAERAGETREIDHPYTLVERAGEGIEAHEGETVTVVSEGPAGLGEVAEETVPFDGREPGAAPAEEV